MSALQNPPTATLAKKPYESPHLQIYGDLAEITNSLNTGSPYVTESGHGGRTAST